MGGLRRLAARLWTAPHVFSLTARRITVRLTGAAIATGGLALLGLGTMGSPVVTGGGAQLVATTLSSVTGISVSCTAGGAAGTVTVSSPQNGETLTLQVFSHTPGDANFVPIAGATEVIDISAGTTTYSYSIAFAPVAGANTYRVEIVGATPVGSWDSSASGSPDTNTKSASFSCGAASTTTTSSTSTTSSTPETSTTSTTTSTPGSSTTSTTSNTPGSSTSSSSHTTTVPGTVVTSSGVGAGVRGASTGTPATGADAEFGFGLGLMIGGGALALGAGRLFRGKKK